MRRPAVRAVAMRGMTARGLAGLFAVSWVVLPGFGLIDLSVTWNADWPQVLEAGWELFSTVIVGAAFVLIVARPRASAPAVAQLLVAALSLGVSAVIAEETRLLWLAGVLALQIVIVGGLSPNAWYRGMDISVSRPTVSRPLLLLAGLGVAPWLAYALHMWASNRQGRPGDVTLGIVHYSVQGALALALLPVLAALRPDVFPFLATCAGVAATYLGLVSVAWPNSLAGLGQAWSVAAMAWGVALLAVTLAQRIRLAPARRTTTRSDRPRQQPSSLDH